MKVFFRNDDVNTLDKELKTLMSVFESEGIPIDMAIEPANIKQDTVDWLRQKKTSLGRALSIVQHGYDHQERIPGKGEFGGRSYEDQYEDIKKGKEIMEELFGLNFFPAFTCPQGGHNYSTIMCLSNLGYKVFSSYHNVYFKNKILYAVGRGLGRTHLLGKRISYHTMKIPGANLLDISMSMSFIKEYSSTEVCQFNNLDFLKKRFKVICESGQNILGVTLHHRYHKHPEDMKLVRDCLMFLKAEGVSFTTLEEIYQGSFIQ